MFNLLSKCPFGSNLAVQFKNTSLQWTSFLVVWGVSSGNALFCTNIFQIGLLHPSGSKNMCPITVRPCHGVWNDVHVMDCFRSKRMEPCQGGSMHLFFSSTQRMNGFGLDVPKRTWIDLFLTFSFFSFFLASFLEAGFKIIYSFY